MIVTCSIAMVESRSSDIRRASNGRRWCCSKVMPWSPSVMPVPTTVPRSRPATGAKRTIECPLHGWRFDVFTGACAHPGDALIPTYEVTIEEGIVYVELPD